jgi:capsid portal protein
VDSNNSKEAEKRAVIRDFDLYQITRVFDVVDSNANVGGDVDAGSIQKECIYEVHCPFENPSDISNQKKEKLKKGRPYTRLMAFKNDIGDSKMGLPYWVGETGNLLALLAYDTLSHKMINNNLIPRLIIMLGGASFSKEQMDDMKEEFETQLSGGSASQNTPLFLNAAGQKATQVASPSEQPIIPEISIHEIKNAFNPDSVKTFFSYVEDRVLKCYRIPRLLIGDTANYNRATADTALQAVESQVFAPLRKEWDTFINNIILGNGFEESQKLSFKSKPMAIMPIEGVLKMLTTLSNIGALTIKDVTNLAQQLVDIKLEGKSDEINKLLSAAVAKLQPTADGATASAVDKSKATKGETTKDPYQNTGQ